jgi:hypothetical protein
MSKHQFRIEDDNEDEVGHGRSFKQFLRENRKNVRTLKSAISLRVTLIGANGETTAFAVRHI